MLCATLLFYAQIFCDFSGYTDIARGCARLMGVRLSENFREPYLADSFQDFWHRWHITLSRFFLDAVYLPLGGNRKGRWKTGCNLLIVFLMSGLWHGANWTYVVWGAVHGLLLAAERMLPQRLRKSGSPILRRAFVFSMVTLSWIFFRAPDLASAFRIFGLILTDFRLAGCLTGLGMTPCEAVMTFGLLILVPLLSPQSLRTLSARRFLPVCLLILLILLSRCLTLSVSGDPAFLYFQF